jgi:ABC-type glutathione transport system ATPase component
MADPGQLSDQAAAAQRRRRWLAERHARTRALVVLLLRQAPEAEVAAALDQLSGGELQRLARLLAHAHEGLDPQPPDQPGPTAATPRP